MHTPIPKYWFDGNPLITSLFNGLSVSIPEIERFIVGSAKDALPHVKNKELEKAVAILTHEEEAHARVHDTYNNLLRKQGYQISKHEAFEHSVAAFFNKQSIKTRLVVCLCSEFFTAVLGRHLVEAKIYNVPGVDSRMSALWTWHSYEELHHRGTAFDLYLDQGGGYFRRAGLMIILTIRWMVAHFPACIAIFFQSKAPVDFKMFLRNLNFILGPRGFYTAVIVNWFIFFKPGFHPKKDIRLEEGLDPELHHFHVEKHFVEVVEAA